MAKKTRQKINLATAEQADGALPSFKSVYELCGIKDIKYRESTFAAYQTRLRAMDLIELQDHAYELAVVPSPSAQIMIDRLEEKYLRENPEQRAALAAARAARGGVETLEEQTERILAQGR
jgi:hypothetical protein